MIIIQKNNSRKCYLNKRTKVKEEVFNETIDEVEDDFLEDNFTDFEINIEKVYSIIEQLPQGYRMVFNLYAIEEYTHKEIAELLKISINTSKSQLRKARKFIVQKLEKEQAYGRA